MHRQIAEFTHTHSPPAQLAILAKNPRILPNFCTLLPYLKRLCLKLTALPLSQEVAFSQQLQKGTCSTSQLLHCKLQFNLQLKSPAHLQCKLTCQTAFCEVRHRHTSPLPTLLRGQEHLAEAEQTAVEVVRSSHSKVHEISFTNGVSHNLQFIAPQCTITAMTA